jgi:hypothetical protein
MAFKQGSHSHRRCARSEAIAHAVQEVGFLWPPVEDGRDLPHRRQIPNLEPILLLLPQSENNESNFGQAEQQ